MNFDEKTTNELLIELKQMELEYESVKQKVLYHHDNAIKFYNEMGNIEKKFKEISKEIVKRNKL